MRKLLGIALLFLGSTTFANDYQVRQTTPSPAPEITVPVIVTPPTSQVQVEYSGQKPPQGALEEPIDFSNKHPPISLFDWEGGRFTKEEYLGNLPDASRQIDRLRRTAPAMNALVHDQKGILVTPSSDSPQRMQFGHWQYYNAKGHKIVAKALPGRPYIKVRCMKDMQLLCRAGYREAWVHHGLHYRLYRGWESFRGADCDNQTEGVVYEVVRDIWFLAETKTTIVTLPGRVETMAIYRPSFTETKVEQPCATAPLVIYNAGYGAEHKSRSGGYAAAGAIALSISNASARSSSTSISGGTTPGHPPTPLAPGVSGGYPPTGPNRPRTGPVPNASSPRPPPYQGQSTQRPG